MLQVYVCTLNRCTHTQSTESFQNEPKLNIKKPKCVKTIDRGDFFKEVLSLLQ